MFSPSAWYRRVQPVVPGGCLGAGFEPARSANIICEAVAVRPNFRYGMALSGKRFAAASSLSTASQTSAERPLRTQ